MRKLQTLDADGYNLLTDEAKKHIEQMENFLKRAADTLQEMEDGDYNNSLAMEIYSFLEVR